MLVIIALTQTLNSAVASDSVRSVAVQRHQLVSLACDALAIFTPLAPPLEHCPSAITRRPPAERNVTTLVPLRQ